jgi:hypothetical protein
VALVAVLILDLAFVFMAWNLSFSFFFLLFVNSVSLAAILTFTMGAVGSQALRSAGILPKSFWQSALSVVAFVGSVLMFLGFPLFYALRRTGVNGTSSGGGVNPLYFLIVIGMIILGFFVTISPLHPQLVESLAYWAVVGALFLIASRQAGASSRVESSRRGPYNWLSPMLLATVILSFLMTTRYASLLPFPMDDVAVVLIGLASYTMASFGRHEPREVLGVLHAEGA